MNSLFHQWTNLLLHTLSNAVVMHHPSPQALSGSRVSGGSNVGSGTSEQRIKDKVRKELHTTVQDMMQPLMSWEKIHRGHCFKTIDTAILNIKLLQSTQPELFKTEDTNSQRNIDEYFKQLEFLATRTLHPQYFIEQNKHIVSLEGLSGVGKSAILDLFVQHHELQFPGKYQKICVVQRNDNSIYSDLWEIFQQLPMFYQLLFQFLENYRIIYEIMVIQKDFNVFIIENYFHSFLTNFILSNESIISTKKDSTYLNYFHVESADEIEGKFPHSSLFDWPLDLPMPELVLYFTCPTLTRLQRKNLSDVSSSIVLSKEREDTIKTTLYSLVKGPGTIGIDTSGSFEEVFTTVFEALDYYGIYSITRPTVPLDENSNELPEVLREGTEEVKDSDVMIEDQILKQKSFDFADVPMESQDVIYNRRISMGVYGMFSKFM